MPRGGERRGAGRPRTPKFPNRDYMPKDIVQEALSEGMTPLEYMLKVMRNPEADQARRDRMAQAAAPYCHPKVGDVKPGKKEIEAEESRTAAEGSKWERLMQVSQPN